MSTLSETTLRRRLDQSGYKLLKSRTRNPDHPTYGGYQVVDLEHGGAVCGHGPFGYAADLDDVAEFVREHC